MPRGGSNEGRFPLKWGPAQFFSPGEYGGQFEYFLILFSDCALSHFTDSPAFIEIVSVEGYENNSIKLYKKSGYSHKRKYRLKFLFRVSIISKTRTYRRLLFTLRFESSQSFTLGTYPLSSDLLGLLRFLLSTLLIINTSV